jgi:DNA primase catalytic subunit
MRSKRQLFRQYYRESFTIDKVVLPELKFRHFRFQLFSEKVCFIRLVDIITKPSQLCEKFIRYIPLNAYFTPVKWLNPIYASHTKDELDVMLSSPLYFDIDMDDLVPSTFSEAKRDTICLVEFLRDEYGRNPDLLVFSGRQGFHIYFWDWDKHDILELDPRERLSEFKKRRTNLLEKLKKRRIVVDERITADPYRIMKIPNSLHGKTGLVAKPVVNVEAFDVKKEALAFEHEIYDRVFELDWKIYE